MRNINTIINTAKEHAFNDNSLYVTPEYVLIELLNDLTTSYFDFRIYIVQLNKYIERFKDTDTGNVIGTSDEIKETALFSKLLEEIEAKIESPDEKTIKNLSDLLVIISDLDNKKNYASMIAASIIKNNPRLLLRLAGASNFEKMFSKDGAGAAGGRLNLGPIGIVFPGHFDVNENEQNEAEEEESPLKVFGENLSEKVRNNPLIHREEEMQRLIEILLRKDKPNPILTGQQGVGKTAIVKELAIRIAEGNVPLAIKEEVKAIYSVEMSTLIAGTSFRGQFEERIKAILEEVKESNRSIILFIDEIHTLMGAGANPNSALDAANILKPYLTDGSIRIIGSTTIDEYRKFIEKDKAMARRFMPVNVEEPTPSDTIEIIQGIKEGYEAFHGVTYSDEAIKAAVDLSVAHIHDRYLPDKAIDLIDEAGAKIAASVLKEEDKASTAHVINIDQIEEVLYNTYKIPKSTVSPDEAEEVRTLEKNLTAKVYGQDDAVNVINKRIKLAKAGIRDKSKPIANLLFVGPTGVGKTEISKVLSESLNMKLLRFDMSEYTEEHTVSKLFGAPAGYVGYDDGGILTNAVRSNPNSVLLLDEIEKAHPKIFNALLQIMDYGIMTDSKGNKADFRNCVLIMTSNAGAAKISKKGMGFGKAAEYMDVTEIDTALSQIFPPEFRGRITDIVKFNDINPDIAERIVRKEVAALAETLREKNIKLSVTDACISYMAQKGYTPMTGARNIKNVVSNDISNLIVDDILFGSLKNGGSVKVDYVDDKYKKNVRKAKESA